MLYQNFPENYLSCSKFAIFLPTNISEEPNFYTKIKKLGMAIKDFSSTLKHE